MAIQLKSREEVEQMRLAGRVVRRVLSRVQELCRPGVTTRELDEEAFRVYTEAGGKGLFKNYPTYKEGEGFPGYTCISINEEVVHGIAGDREVREGDIVSVDCGVAVDGWCGDAATTIPVGDIPPRTKDLCEATQHVLDLAVSNLKPGRRWSQIARVMQQYAESRGYGVVRDMVGHGIGRQMHEDPKVPNYVDRKLLHRDLKLREGMVLAIEPMLNLGTHRVETLADGWTIVTRDRHPSAHYEHTVALMSEGAELLTGES